MSCVPAVSAPVWQVQAGLCSDSKCPHSPQGDGRPPLCRSRGATGPAGSPSSPDVLWQGPPPAHRPPASRSQWQVSKPQTLRGSWGSRHRMTRVTASGDPTRTWGRRDPADLRGPRTMTMTGSKVPKSLWRRDRKTPVWAKHTGIRVPVASSGAGERERHLFPVDSEETVPSPTSQGVSAASGILCRGRGCQGKAKRTLSRVSWHGAHRCTCVHLSTHTCACPAPG